MAITTYAQLQTALGDWTESTLHSGQFTTFIALAEAEIRREMGTLNLRVREAETRTAMTPSSGACTLPSDYQAMKKVQARTSSVRRLEYKTMDWLDEAYPDGASGDPSFYTILSGTLYMFPLTTSDIRIDYYAYPAALTDSATTNWLLTKYPDVYLWASLKQLKAYEQDEAGIAKMDGLFKQALGGMSNANFGSDQSPGTSMSTSMQAV